MENLIIATYVSVWGSGERIETSCKFNPNTLEVTDIGQADVDNFDDYLLLEEFIELADSTTIRNFKHDDLMYIDGELIYEDEIDVHYDNFKEYIDSRTNLNY